MNKKIDKDRAFKAIKYLIDETDNDNIIWLKIFDYKDITGYIFKTMIKITNDKFIVCYLSLSLENKNSYTFNKLDIEIEKKIIDINNYFERKRLFSFYFKQYENLKLLSNIILYKNNFDIDPYLNYKKNILKYIEYIKLKISSASPPFADNAKNEIDNYLSYMETNVKKTYNLNELKIIDDRLTKYSNYL